MAGKMETFRDAESRNQNFSSSESGMMQEERGRQVAKEQGRKICLQDEEALLREELPLGLCRSLKRQRQIPRIHKTMVIPGGQ